MKFVEIYRTNDDGQELAGRVVMEAGEMRFEGLSKKMVDILKDGILGLEEFGFVKPEDGEIFLEMLCYEFTGSKIRASRVFEAGKEDK